MAGIFSSLHAQSDGEALSFPISGLPETCPPQSGIGDLRIHGVDVSRGRSLQMLGCYPFDS